GHVPSPALPVFGAWNFQASKNPEEAAAAAAAASAAARLRCAPSAQTYDPERDGGVGSGGAGFTAMFANKGKERRAMRIVDGRIMEVPSGGQQANVTISSSASSESRSPNRIPYIPPDHPLYHLYHSPLSGSPDRPREPSSQPRQSYLPGLALEPIASNSVVQSISSSSSSAFALNAEESSWDQPSALAGSAAATTQTAQTAAAAAAAALAATPAADAAAEAPSLATSEAPQQPSAPPPSLAELQSLRLRLVAGENLSPLEMQRLTDGVLALMSAAPAAAAAVPATAPAVTAGAAFSPAQKPASANEPAGYAQASPPACHLGSCASSDSSPESSPPRRPLRYYSPVHPSTHRHDSAANPSLLFEAPAWARDAPSSEAAVRSGEGSDGLGDAVTAPRNTAAAQLDPSASVPEPRFQPCTAQQYQAASATPIPHYPIPNLQDKHTPVGSPIDRHMAALSSSATSSPSFSSPAPPPPPLPYALPPSSYNHPSHGHSDQGPSPMALLPLEPEEDDGGFTWEGWSVTGGPIREQNGSACTAAGVDGVASGAGVAGVASVASDAGAADWGYGSSGPPLDFTFGLDDTGSTACTAISSVPSAAAPEAMSTSFDSNSSGVSGATAAGAAAAAAAVGSAPVAAVPSTGSPAIRSAPRIPFQLPYSDWDNSAQHSKVRFQGGIAHEAEGAGYTKMFQDRQARKKMQGEGFGFGNLGMPVRDQSGNTGAEQTEWNAGVAAALAGISPPPLPPHAGDYSAAGTGTGVGAGAAVALPPPPYLANPAAAAGGHGGPLVAYSANPGMYIPQPNAMLGLNGPPHGTHAADAHGTEHGRVGMRHK
ncbi:unnamed protein product, partial [Closterium sp. NIES-53]